MPKRLLENYQERPNKRSKKQLYPKDDINIDPEMAKYKRQERIKERKRKGEDNKPNQIVQQGLKRRCLNIAQKHAYLSLPYGMIYFPPEYIQYLKESYKQRSYCGKPDYKCKYCNAIFWYDERNKYDSKRGNGEILYSNCCKYGKIRIPKYREPPQFLKTLLNQNEDKKSKHFLQKIRQYNSMFAFTSMGGNIDKTINQGEGPYVFRVNGQIHHHIGSLLPEPNKIPKFAELYIFDTKNEIENRLRALTKEEPDRHDLNPAIIKGLQEMLDQHNPLVKIFRHARDLFEEHKGIDISIRILGANKGDPIQYEMPYSEDLAMLIVGDITAENYKRDIIVSTKKKSLQRISIFHPAYLPLQYPLLFPYGERGFQLGIKYHEDTTSPIRRKRKGKRNTMTVHEFLKYHMHFRDDQPNPWLCYGRLSKQAIVDARAMEDEDRLQYIARNQDKLRAEYIKGIFDAVEKGMQEGNQIGKRVLLPSSHIGCRRYIIQNYHDGIAICRVYGPPDLFITFTCNPKWPEITSTILESQHPNDRPDIIVRIFHMKLQQLLDDICSGTIFGPILAILYSIEFQKRGLPHVHILVWVDKKGNEITAEIIDAWITAEIPDPTTDPLGYILVSEHMLHGPCGEKNLNCPCMKKGRCSKFYPKEFQEETTFTHTGFTVYRRRDTGIYIRRDNHNLDNRWVVPHNL